MRAPRFSSAAANTSFAFAHKTAKLWVPSTSPSTTRRGARGRPTTMTDLGWCHCPSGPPMHPVAARAASLVLENFLSERLRRSTAEGKDLLTILVEVERGH
mmetsp:Transcript_13921/g.44627  ORF Transcript_13921/g.44627 Transcript_13921/m.44627 type:complete len:101 (+) Transcript_13921:448-750(+)